MDRLEVTCHFPRIAEDSTELLIAEYQSQNLPVPDMRFVRTHNQLDIRKEYDGELGRIVRTVNTVYQRALNNLFPEHQDVVSSLYGEELCRIIGQVKYALSMVPIDEKDEDGKLNCYELFTLEAANSPDLTERYMPHYQALENHITQLLIARYELLGKFFTSKSPKDTEELGESIDSCLKDLHTSRCDKIKLCHQLCIDDKLNPKISHSSDFENAVDWNQRQKQNLALKDFSPSNAENKLIKYVKGGFSKYDVAYFTFSFTTKQERPDMRDRDRYTEDIRRMNQFIYERKMYIAYHVCRYIDRYRGKCGDFDLRDNDRDILILLLREIEIYRDKVGLGPTV